MMHCGDCGVPLNWQTATSGYEHGDPKCLACRSKELEQHEQFIEQKLNRPITQEALDLIFKNVPSGLTIPNRTA